MSPDYILKLTGGCFMRGQVVLVGDGGGGGGPGTLSWDSANSLRMGNLRPAVSLIMPVGICSILGMGFEVLVQPYCGTLLLPSKSGPTPLDSLVHSLSLFLLQCHKPKQVVILTTVELRA